MFIILIYSCQRCLLSNLATRWARTSKPNRPETAHEHYFHHPTHGKGSALTYIPANSFENFTIALSCDPKEKIRNNLLNTFQFICER